MFDRRAILTAVVVIPLPLVPWRRRSLALPSIATVGSMRKKVDGWRMLAYKNYARASG
jgi:hypothetical protein